MGMDPVALGEVGPIKWIISVGVDPTPLGK